jgi:GGDEF domain-containing protein
VSDQSDIDDTSPEVDFANDGRVDRLTGLDAAEIFYLMLSKEFASADRRMNQAIFLITFTLRSQASAAAIAAQLIALSQILRRATRSEELLTRLGRMTFVVALGVDLESTPESTPESKSTSRVDSELTTELVSEDASLEEVGESQSKVKLKYAAIVKRYSNQVEEFLDLGVSPMLNASTPEDANFHTRVGAGVGQEHSYVDIKGFERIAGETLLNFLERAEV